MSDICRAKITVYLDREGINDSKYFAGTEQEVLMEAHDWTYEFACRYINKNNIDDYSTFQKINSGIKPNPMVKRILTETIFGKVDYSKIFF